ncbi:hypothetical protein PanWU01x14_281330 [Parasponia andersonii]|uniref:Uncharacterized protein n=1 Tax=Parasponia andersonii TaxID=3476 RepID=A0A2P5B158_PARAD|nr:hypothetical protein PanWU01x14_281330 [Parasponia andersonii]
MKLNVRGGELNSMKLNPTSEIARSTKKVIFVYGSWSYRRAQQRGPVIQVEASDQWDFVLAHWAGPDLAVYRPARSKSRVGKCELGEGLAYTSPRGEGTA